MSTPRLIGLGGKLRAGKDAVGDYLVTQHGYVKMGMSDALNEALLKLNPIIHTGPKVHGFENYVRYAELHDRVGYVEAKKNPEVRRLLQILGTEVGRQMIDQDVWVTIAERRIRSLWDEGKSVVITAMRFPNEIEMLKRLNGLSVWIDRPEELRSNGLEFSEGITTPARGLKDVTEPSRGISEHASENSVNADMFSRVIINDSTLEELYQKVEMILEEHHTLDRIHAGNFYPPYDR